MNTIRGYIEDRKSVKRLYFLSLFLIGLPPFYILSSYINLHTAAKVIWFLIFAIFLFGLKEIKFKRKEKILFIFFLALFIVQSLSSLGAVSMIPFLIQYEDIFFAAMFFFVSLQILDGEKDLKKVIYIFLTATFINLLIQFAIFIVPQIFLTAAEYVLPGGYVELIKLNVERKRVYFASYDEIFIPLAFAVYSTANNSLKKRANILLVIFISIASFISSFRTRFLMLTVSFFGSFVIFSKKIGKRLITVGLVLAALFMVLYMVISQSLGFTVLNRLSLEHRTEDVGTITSRSRLWGEAIDMGVSYIPFGVGIGNYYDHLGTDLKYTISVFEQRRQEHEKAIYYPHNIVFKTFAETGFIGFLVLVAIVIYFAKEDLGVIFKKDRVFKKAFIVSFWTLFLHALLNPSFTIKFMSLFWLTRVAIVKLKT